NTSRRGSTIGGSANSPAPQRLSPAREIDRVNRALKARKIQILTKDCVFDQPDERSAEFGGVWGSRPAPHKPTPALCRRLTGSGGRIWSLATRGRRPRGLPRSAPQSSVRSVAATAVDIDTEDARSDSRATSRGPPSRGPAATGQNRNR